MDIPPPVQEYVDAIPAEHRPLFDRMHSLVVAEHPEAEMVLSYRIPCYRVGRRRLFLAAWAHGVSLYGWGQDRDAGFSARHPDLLSGRGTIRLRTGISAEIPDREFRDLFRATLSS